MSERIEPQQSLPSAKPVERLFPFAVRARVLIVGREALRRQKKKLQFLLVTQDLSANSLAELAADFPGVPLAQRYTSAQVEEYFGFKGTKVLGFKKSSIARSIQTELHTGARPVA